MTGDGGIQVLLLGGRADGLSLRLRELPRELVVVVNGTVTVHVANPDLGVSQPPSGGTSYMLVEPVGPEMPVYVQS